MAMSLLAQTIDQLSREKGIEPEIIVSALEDAMVVAARKYYRTEEELRSRFEQETGHIIVYAVRKVVEQVADPVLEMGLEEARGLDPNVEVGGEVYIPKPTDVLGRIAAQTAKQVIFQKVREAERDIVFAEYDGRAGELLHCMVTRVEGPEVIVEIGRHEARMPRREQSRLETYHTGDRLRVVIREVDKTAKGLQVMVSRADPALVQRLFEMEVPEIYDGTVQIKAIAREAGERTKIAVQSRDRDVDPVGACVGMKGMRVQSIIRELRGEKIDIIQWNEDPVQFATNSLSPAKVSRVTLVEGDERQLEVVVEDSQLSLAIGKKGQNVRLASRLLDRRIDIKSEEEKRQEIEAQMASLMSSTARTPVENLKGLGKKTMEKLGEHGISSIEELAAMTPEQLMEIPGVGEKMVQKIADAVKQHFEPDVAEADTPEASAAEVPAEPKTAEESERPAAAVLADAPAPAQEAPPEEEVAEAVTAGSGEEGSKAAEEGGAEKELAAETTESESKRAD